MIEYREEFVFAQFSPPSGELDFLNDLGQRGWELILIQTARLDGMNRYLFKRSKAGEPE